MSSGPTRVPPPKNRYRKYTDGTDTWYVNDYTRQSVWVLPEGATLFPEMPSSTRPPPPPGPPPAPRPKLGTNKPPRRRFKKMTDGIDTWFVNVDTGESVWAPPKAGFEQVPLTEAEAAEQAPFLEKKFARRELRRAKKEAKLQKQEAEAEAAERERLKATEAPPPASTAAPIQIIPQEERVTLGNKLLKMGYKELRRYFGFAETGLTKAEEKQLDKKAKKFLALNFNPDKNIGIEEMPNLYDKLDLHFGSALGSPIRTRILTGGKKLRGAGFDQLMSIRSAIGSISATNAGVRQAININRYKKAFTLLGAYPPNDGQPLKRPGQVALLNALHMIAVIEKENGLISQQELNALPAATVITPEAIKAFAENFVNTMPQDEEGEGQGKKRGGRFPTSINTQDIENIRKFLRGDAMFSLLPQRLTSYLGLISLDTLPMPLGKIFVDLKRQGRSVEDIDDELAQLVKSNHPTFADFIKTIKADLAEYDAKRTSKSSAESVLEGGAACKPPYHDYSKGKASVFALTCIDPRYTYDAAYFLQHKKELHQDYDLFTLAGASVGASKKEWTKSFFDNLELGIKLHGIKEVWCFDHLDCGMYKATFGLKDDLDPKIHIDCMEKLRKLIKKKHPELKFRSFLIDAKGHVSSV